MKPFEQQTYYELLEVPPSAPADDIRAAYSRLMELYAPDSIAVYALVDPEQVDSLRARMTEAMEILTDADLRAEYDKDLGLPTQRMVEAVAAAGKPSNEATPGVGTVARAAEALASSAAVSAAEAGAVAASGTEAPVATVREEPARAVTSTPPPAEPATSPAAPGDFRSTFFRGFSFAYVSSSLQDTQLLGSSVYVPASTPATSAASPASGPVVSASTQAPSELGASAPTTSSTAAVSGSSEAGTSAPVSASVSTSTAPIAASVAPEPASSAPVPSAASLPAEPAPSAPPVDSRTSTPAATEPARAAGPASTALATVPARQEGTPVSRPQPGARTTSSRGTADAQPLPLPTTSEPARQAPRPGAGRQLGDAQVLSQDSAIATAEAALAQVAARVREPQARPRTPEIPSDAEFNGELLRRVREARGQSLQQVADRTRITRGHLENVEADRYSALPPPVYLRGILMNLARELGLDPLRVSRSYLALASEKSGKK